jgi:hypothetical protein
MLPIFDFDKEDAAWIHGAVVGSVIGVISGIIVTLTHFHQLGLWP